MERERGGEGKRERERESGWHNLLSFILLHWSRLVLVFIVLGLGLGLTLLASFSFSPYSGFINVCT